LPTSKRLPLPGTDPVEPPRLALTAAERRVVERLRTPRAVQRWLNALPYNDERGGETLRGFRGVVRTGTAHCLEAALAAATILEQHGYPPLVLSFESIDLLDHVIFVYRTASGWGSIARSRDPGLHGRKPVFATARALASSYLDTYVDLSGRINAYTVFDLRELGEYDWRLSERNVWKAERMLLEAAHRPLRMPDARFRSLRERYRAFKAQYPDRKPIKYDGSDQWTEIPEEFLRRLPTVNRDRNRGWVW
jgi:hypothetical protein